MSQHMPLKQSKDPALSIKRATLVHIFTQQIVSILSNSASLLGLCARFESNRCPSDQRKTGNLREFLSNSNYSPDAENCSS